jgi:formylglycine-generating enzyme required for sulfatase activity
VAIDDYAWNDNNSKGTAHPVGTKTANELGLCDMSGNVWEWCWDWCASGLPGTLSDYRGAASGTAREVRGGCFFNSSTFSNDYFLLASRDISCNQQYSSGGVGFRVVRP